MLDHGGLYANYGYSKLGLWDRTEHYDKQGNLLGYSKPGLWGRTEHYDRNGNQIGYSTEDAFNHQDHYDKQGNRVGYSKNDLAGRREHYDANGKLLGYNKPEMLGRSDYESKMKGLNGPGMKVQQSYSGGGEESIKFLLIQCLISFGLLALLILALGFLFLPVLLR